jgi:hypothetical protein
MAALLGDPRESLAEAIFAGAAATVITCCHDGIVRVWEGARARMSVNVDAPVEAVAYFDGLIVCGDVLGGVHFLKLADPAIT